MCLANAIPIVQLFNLSGRKELAYYLILFCINSVRLAVKGIDDPLP